MGRQRGIETKKVEKAAVLAVQNLIHQCLTIDEKLDADDKNMLVDGPLELYCSSNMVIPNLIGRIQTQVKGTTRGARIDKRGLRDSRLRSKISSAIVMFFMELYSSTCWLIISSSLLARCITPSFSRMTSA